MMSIPLKPLLAFRTYLVESEVDSSRHSVSQRKSIGQNKASSETHLRASATVILLACLPWLHGKAVPKAASEIRKRKTKPCLTISVFLLLAARLCTKWQRNRSILLFSQIALKCYHFQIRYTKICYIKSYSATSNHILLHKHLIF